MAESVIHIKLHPDTEQEFLKLRQAVDELNAALKSVDGDSFNILLNLAKLVADVHNQTAGRTGD